MKRCGYCGAGFRQRKSESNWAFERRTACSTKCQSALFNDPVHAAIRAAHRGMWGSAGRVLAGKEGNDAT